MFKNREQAGNLLSKNVIDMLASKGTSVSLVVALPRGGVPVAKEIASALKTALTILISNEIDAPFQANLVLGAVTSSGTVVLDENLCDAINVVHRYVELESRRLAETSKVLERHWMQAAGIHGRPKFDGASIVLVDDGIATGFMTLAAIRQLRAAGAREVIVATPVITLSAYELIKRECDSVVSLAKPKEISEIAEFYKDFHRVEDNEVIEILRRFAGSEKPELTAC